MPRLVKCFRNVKRDDSGLPESFVCCSLSCLPGGVFVGIDDRAEAFIYFVDDMSG